MWGVLCRFGVFIAAGILRWCATGREDPAVAGVGARMVSRLTTVRRRVSTMKVSAAKTLTNMCPAVPVEARIECDSHADTCVLGRNFVVLGYTGRECDVMPYSENYDAVSAVPIVSGGTAFTDQTTNETVILVVNEALHMPDQVEHSLINPNQLRAFGSIVQDNSYSGAPMYFTDPDKSVVVPMFAAGTVIFADTRTPTDEELATCRHVHLTSELPWNPETVQFPQAEWTIAEDMARRVASTSTVRGDSEDVAEEDSEDVLFNVDGFNRRICASVRVHAIPKDRKASAVDVSGPTTPNTFVSQGRRSDVTPEKLADRWFIGLDQAILTLKHTTQRLVRSALLPLSRRYKADRMHRTKTLSGEWFTDTIDGHSKTRTGNRYGQLFANESYFATIYPMDSKGKAGDALRTFCREFGVPEILRFDGSKEQSEKGTEFMKQIKKHGIKYRIAEPEMHNQSPAEGVVREVRRKWYRVMVRKKVPRMFWDYGMRWVCETMQRTHLRGHRIDGGVPLQKVLGETVDISEYLDFGFYDRVWFRDNSGLGPEMIGRWLGVSEHTGTEMCYYILLPNGSVVSRSTVWCITELEKMTESTQAYIKEYDEKLDEYLGDKRKFPPMTGDKPDPEMWADLMEDDPDFREEFYRVYNSDDVKEADEATPGVDDGFYLNMELALPRDADGPSFARVKKRMKDADGNPVGTFNKNPILDTRMFEVEFADGYTASMSANAITESMFAQVDQEGNRLMLLDEIIDHRFTSEALGEIDAWVYGPNGKKHRKATTKGCDILIHWKDGSETWTSLKDVKESYPVELAEYAVKAGVHELPQFAWWVPQTIRRRAKIVSKVKSKYWDRTHKYGIRIPKTVQEAKRLDAENGNTLWWDSICKEMANVRIAFEEQESVPVGYKYVGMHIVFDVKLGENYRRKARLVAEGHKTDSPASITYSSVVSRDSVRIGFLMAALNGLDVLACDIQNAYLTAPCREKFYTIAGPEFGSDAGKIMKITRALYGLKSSGASFRSFLSEHLYDLGYRASYADPDVYMRAAVAPNGFEYYEYVMTYVDDVLCISKDPGKTINGIRDRFTLKGDKAAEPEDYLGARIEKMTTANGTECWAQSADKYLAESVKNVDATLVSRGQRPLPTKGCPTPLSNKYRPELDVSAELGREGHQYYQELIGVLRWAVELGRLDILLEVSLMSAYLASPREGHLEEVLHIFAYIKQHPKRKLAFDPDSAQINQARFKKYEWTDFYRDAKEAIPSNMPEPRGNPVSIHCFVDANLAGDVATRRSQTGILIFVNRAPILWHSKRQNTVESSTFGSEIVALKNAIELIEGLRYKLRMFGIPIDGPADIFCDNEAVTKNCSIPESTLKKKHHSIAYHRNREAVAAGTVRIAWEDTATNLADLFTKVLSAERRNQLMDSFMY